jgi:hypothetical protein
MRNRLFRLVGNPGFELPEVISHCAALVAVLYSADGFELEQVLAAREMRAEAVEDRRVRERGELSPDGEKLLLATEKRGSHRVAALPGDVTTQLNRHPRPQSGTRLKQNLDRVRSGKPSMKEEVGLRAKVLRLVEEPVETTGNVLRPLDQRADR